jgi:hypothetical protein
MNNIETLNNALIKDKLIVNDPEIVKLSIQINTILHNFLCSSPADEVKEEVNQILRIIIASEEFGELDGTDRSNIFFTLQEFISLAEKTQPLNEKFISLLTLKNKAMQSTQELINELIDTLKTNKLSEEERILTLERLRNAVNSIFE